MRNHMANCMLDQGFLYGFDGNSHNRRNVNLVCMELASGDVRWKHNGLGCGSLQLAGDRLLILGDEGELVAAQPSPQGYQPLASCRPLEDDVGPCRRSLTAGSIAATPPASWYAWMSAFTPRTLVGAAGATNKPSLTFTCAK